MGREAKVGIQVTADTKMAEAGLERVGKGAKKMGETAARLAPVLQMTSGALGGMGGAGAQAAGQIAGLVGMVGVGGPLAVGVVALGAVVSAGVQIWKAWTFEASLAADEAERFAQINGDRLARTAGESTAKIESMEARIAELNGTNRAAYQLGVLREAQERRMIQIMGGGGGSEVQAEAEARHAQLTREIATTEKLIAAEAKSTTEKEASKRREEALAEAIRSTAAAEQMAMNASKKRWEETKAAQAAAMANARAANDDAMSAELVRVDTLRKLDARIQDQLTANAATNAERRGMIIEQETAFAISKAQEEVDARQQLGQTVIGVAGDIASALMAKNREMTADERAAATVQMAVKLAVGLASAIAAGAGVAWPANIAAIASGVAAVGAAFATIASFAEGGFVGGGRQGRDSVPARLMPGEYVMSRGEVAGMSTLVRRFGATQGAANAMMGMVQGGQSRAPGGQSGGTTIVNITNQALVPDMITGMRVAKGQAQHMAKLAKRGMLKAS